MPTTPQAEPQQLRQSTRESKPRARLTYAQNGKAKQVETTNYALMTTIMTTEEPVYFEDTVDKPKWQTTMNEEMDALYKNDTWELCDLPPGKKAIVNKWVCKVKYNPDGSIQRYKARLVAKGFAQQYG